MPDAYRDEKDALRARNERLEEELARRDAELDALRRRISGQEAVFGRLEATLDAKAHCQAASWRWALFGVGAAAALGLVSLGLWRGPLFSVAEAQTGPRRASAAVPPGMAGGGEDEAAPRGALCERLGVRLTVDGADVEAPARGERDLSGHKYRRDGSRSPWFTVRGGPLYVHAVGGYLPGDVGETELTLFTIATEGEAGGYRLARGGRSLLEVKGSGGGRVFGRFEADVSRVDDTTREPPFGTPVVRARGTFCLPALPADPSDTGP